MSGFGRSPSTRHLSNRKAKLENSQMDPYTSTFLKKVIPLKDTSISVGYELNPP